MDWTNALILLAAIGNAAALECFSCKGTIDVSKCNSTERCMDGQACFRNTTNTGGVEKTNLGCVAYQGCGTQGTVQTSIVGRGVNIRQTTSCTECCNSDYCNKNLCEHLKPTVCVDDESIDCPKLNSLFSICVDIDHAKKVCPKFCGLCDVVDGNWSTWSPWSQCDVTCENGTRTRTRSCTNPAPQHGGLDCQGNHAETKPCVKELCPVHGGWSAWEHWATCSHTCGIGLQDRVRNCSNPIPIRNGNPCFGHSINVRKCMQSPCHDGGWSDWSSWSSCSVTCDVGVRTQSRSCTNPHPSPFGSYCQGDNIKVETCARNDCEQSHCRSSPCVYGQCIDNLHNYVCVCSPGFGGRNCSEELYLCRSSPCAHGQCVDNLKDYVCVCRPGYYGRNCNQGLSSDCYDVLHDRVGRKSGVYPVTLWKSQNHVDVYCDLEISGGGWTVFQHRFNGSVDFFRNFKNYTQGFGSMDGEFWIGLEHIYEMVSQGVSELRIDLMAADGTTAYEVFPNFSLSPDPDYTLHIGKGSGTAGDTSGLSYHNGHNFYTYDHDNNYNCASTNWSHGAWWYNHCTYVNLNGLYLTPGTVGQTSGEEGMVYREFQGEHSLKRSKMMFRRTSN